MQIQELYRRVLEVYHHFGTPFLMALTLSLFKKLAEDDIPSLADANDTALDLIFVSLGAMSVIGTKSWTAEKYLSAFAGNLLLAALLLTVRAYRRRNVRSYTKLGLSPPPVSISHAAIELLIGVSSILWTVNAP